MLVPFISTTPFPVAVFGWDWFTPAPKMQTPPELRAGGCMTVDLWAPMTIAYIYAFLIHAHPAFLAPYDLVRWAIRNSTAFTAFLMDFFGHDGGNQLPLWVYGHEPWSPRDASALCAIILTALFSLRALYNFGGKSWIGGEPSPLSSAEKEKMDRALGLDSAGMFTEKALLITSRRESDHWKVKWCSAASKSLDARQEIQE